LTGALDGLAGLFLVLVTAPALGCVAGFPVWIPGLYRAWFGVENGMAALHFDPNRRAAGQDLGGRRQTCTDPQVRSAAHLVESGQPAARVARDLGMSRATLCRRIRDLPVAT
jgi:hypothetical protein